MFFSMLINNLLFLRHQYFRKENVRYVDLQKKLIKYEGNRLLTVGVIVKINLTIQNELNEKISLSLKHKL